MTINIRKYMTLKYCQTNEFCMIIQNLFLIFIRYCYTKFCINNCQKKTLFKKVWHSNFVGLNLYDHRILFYRIGCFYIKFKVNNCLKKMCEI